MAQAALMLITMAVAPVWADAWPGMWSKIAAVVLGGLGAIFGIFGALVLGRSRTVFPEPLPEARLVCSGIYGIVRHPIYTSVILLFLAWALWWRSLPGLALALVIIGFLDAKARHEERRLHLKFPDYECYSRRVKRLLPWIY
jgi:protein-S-isoprenylcysteine O-methyltransferase Ste14